jgi:site-specific DNA-methyltransferase (cytosine-N4-specific)
VATALTDARWVLRNDIIWHKPNGLPHPVEDRFTNRYEHILLLTKRADYYFNLAPLRLLTTRGEGTRRPDPSRPSHPDGANPGDVWKIAPARSGPDHTAVFPLEIPRRCITAGCPPGGVVLDPFSGSGTTGVAAKASGCRYIGIDLHPAYHDLAVQRLAETSALSQPCAGATGSATDPVDVAQ